jgi:small-conductance mechanosensitive channel
MDITSMLQNYFPVVIGVVGVLFVIAVLKRSGLTGPLLASTAIVLTTFRPI